MEGWYLYAGFIAFVVAMLLVDLRLFHAQAHETSTREAAIWVGIWVGLALAFAVVLFFWKGGESTTEYVAGYLTEYALSVDNMFVFILIFQYFRVPPEYQHQVLFYGILGAIFFRGVFIALGAALISTFSWIIYVFGALLIIAAVRIAVGTEEVHPDRNPVLTFARRIFPTTSRYDGQRMFTFENGRKVATPLFIVLLVIETTDIVFAIDSIPAIFGITRDPFIVLTSNVFAILGLRALYFLLSGSMRRFHFLKYGLSLILGFVGVKMILSGFHIHIESWASLAFIVTTLAVTALASLRFPPKETEVRPAGDLPHGGAFPNGGGPPVAGDGSDSPPSEPAERLPGG